MRQFALFALYLFAQAGFAGGGFLFAVKMLVPINPLLAFGFILFLFFEIVGTFVYVLAPLMVWAKRHDDAASAKRIAAAASPDRSAP